MGLSHLDLNENQNGEVERKILPRHSFFIAFLESKLKISFLDGFCLFYLILFSFCKIQLKNTEKCGKI